MNLKKDRRTDAVKSRKNLIVNRFVLIWKSENVTKILMYNIMIYNTFKYIKEANFTYH